MTNQLKVDLKAISPAEVKLTLSGTLDFESVQTVKKILRDNPVTAIDLRGVSFVGSSGISDLVCSVIEAARLTENFELICCLDFSRVFRAFDTDNVILRNHGGAAERYSR